ncbi:hypothetical protein OROMI_005602 [Orobanche minor]
MPSGEVSHDPSSSDSDSEDDFPPAKAEDLLYDDFRGSLKAAKRQVQHSLEKVTGDEEVFERMTHQSKLSALYQAQKFAFQNQLLIVTGLQKMEETFKSEMASLKSSLLAGPSSLPSTCKSDAKRGEKNDKNDKDKDREGGSGSQGGDKAARSQEGGNKVAGNEGVSQAPAPEPMSDKGASEGAQNQSTAPQADEAAILYSGCKLKGKAVMESTLREYIWKGMPSKAGPHTQTVVEEKDRLKVKQIISTVVIGKNDSPKAPATRRRSAQVRQRTAVPRSEELQIPLQTNPESDMGTEELVEIFREESELALQKLAEEHKNLLAALLSADNEEKINKEIDAATAISKISAVSIPDATATAISEISNAVPIPDAVPFSTTQIAVSSVKRRRSTSDRAQVGTPQRNKRSFNPPQSSRNTLSKKEVTPEQRFLHSITTIKGIINSSRVYSAIITDRFGNEHMKSQEWFLESPSTHLQYLFFKIRDPSPASKGLKDLIQKELNIRVAEAQKNNPWNVRIDSTKWIIKFTIENGEVEIDWMGEKNTLTVRQIKDLINILDTFKTPEGNNFKFLVQCQLNKIEQELQKDPELIVNVDADNIQRRDARDMFGVGHGTSD